MAPALDHERLDVYRAELQFVAWCEPLLRRLSEQDGLRCREVMDHLDRAALSALLNTAEGNGKRQEATRAKFFDIAPTQFRHELSKLSPSDVMELKTGIGDTTLNY